MTDEKRSRVLGMILGSVSRGQFPQREPVAFLYNGVRLPDIDSVWTDKETYPYAMIWRYRFPDGSQYPYADDKTRVYFSNLPFGTRKGYTADGRVMYNPHEEAILHLVSRFPYGEVDWAVGTEVNRLGAGSYYQDDVIFIWSNYDIIDENNGTLYLAASEPIPVYE